MRETADFPNKRLELMIGFARARMNSIEELRAATQDPPDRAGEDSRSAAGFSLAAG